MTGQLRHARFPSCADIQLAGDLLRLAQAVTEHARMFIIVLQISLRLPCVLRTLQLLACGESYLISADANHLQGSVIQGWTVLTHF